MAARILIVDDDPLVGQTLRILLTKHGYEVEASASAEEAMKRMEDQVFDLVISDINMPGADGFDLAHRILGGRRGEHAVSGQFQVKRRDFGEDGLCFDQKDALLLPTHPRCP